MNSISQIEKLNYMKNLNMDVSELEMFIEKYSIYNYRFLSVIITKLMTNFEGVEYQAIPYFNIYTDLKYLICENDLTKYPWEFNLPTLKYSKYNKVLFDKYDREFKCLFSPSGYPGSFENKEDDLFYIQDFADYLFKIRVEKNIVNISLCELEKLLEEYLKITIKQQKERQNKRIESTKKKKEERVIKDFQYCCNVDRQTFLSSIVYLINNYSNDRYFAAEQLKEERQNSTTLVLYQNIKIVDKYENKVLSFDGLIDVDAIYPEEEKYKYINKNKDMNISFYNVKKEFKSLEDNCEIYKIFMDKIESLYDKYKYNMPKPVSKEEVLQALKEVCSLYNKNNKVLLKK